MYGFENRVTGRYIFERKKKRKKNTLWYSEEEGSYFVSSIENELMVLVHMYIERGLLQNAPTG